MPEAENRINRRLAAAASAGRGSLLPYLTGGYPDPAATAEWIRRFDARGVTALEIGFPYSDSIADGPVIQESFNRALAAGLRVGELFDVVTAVRREVDIALLAMVSISLVRRRGIETFLQQAAACGFDGLIVPDLPYEETDEVSGPAAGCGLRHVLLVAAGTPPARAAEIARCSTGFVYQVSVRGVTGERDRLPENLRTRVEGLRSAGGKPVCVGFGVSNAAQVREVCRVADGAIVGSAVVRRITEALDRGQTRETILETVVTFVDELAEGVR